MGQEEALGRGMETMNELTTMTTTMTTANNERQQPTRAAKVEGTGPQLKLHRYTSRQDMNVIPGRWDVSRVQGPRRPPNPLTKNAETAAKRPLRMTPADLDNQPFICPIFCTIVFSTLILPILVYRKDLSRLIPIAECG